MANIKVGGRELALAFTICAMDKMEQILDKPINLEDVKDTITQVSKDRKLLVQVLAILANEGEAEAGREPDVTPAWLSAHMRPGLLPAAQIAVFHAVTEGMRMETADEGQEEEVDLVLEELKKNPAREA